ncbi:MAG: hypothetical protein KDB26_10115 [Microthrixaceae bacterium]|nr:hypothetical protein [Microthrixaceae bacterium]
MGRLKGNLAARAAVVIAAVALLSAITSCSAAAPKAVLNVPGEYVANLWEPTLEYPSGGPIATVLMCLDEQSAVLIETGSGGMGSIGSIKLDWGGTVHTVPSTGDPVTMTTPVLEPGCGLLTFGVDCCHVDNFLAVKVSKVPA